MRHQNRSSIIVITYRLLLTVAVLAPGVLSGCSHGGGTIGTGFGGSSFGGGTTGTGLTYGTSGGEADQDGVSYFNLEGTLVDEKGSPLSGVVVTVETARQSDTSTTDAEGRFDVTAAARAGDELRFYFHAAKLNAKHIHKNVPREVSGASFDFRLSGARVILLRKELSTAGE